MKRTAFLLCICIEIHLSPCSTTIGSNECKHTLFDHPAVLIMESDQLNDGSRLLSSLTYLDPSFSVVLLNHKMYA